MGLGYYLLRSFDEPHAGVAELADAYGSGPYGVRPMGVQVPSPAPETPAVRTNGFFIKLREQESLMTYAAYIFDLDGTLLNTLPDLVRLTNMVLEQREWPQRTEGEILSYVGNGGRMLLKRAAPEWASEAEIEEAFVEWQKLYPTYGHALTEPYEGIPETLAQLKAKGAKLGVLSNKFDEAAQEVIARHFPGLFDVVRGECAEIPRKPDPRGLQNMLAQMGITPQQLAYVGDSDTDMRVAVAVGALPVGVSWGYRPVKELEEAGAQTVINSPEELLAL